MLAALATGRMLLGDFGDALPVAERAVTVAQQAGAVAEHAHGLATLGIVLAYRGEFDAGIAALRTSFSLARRTGNVEDIVRAAANHYTSCTRLAALPKRSTWRERAVPSPSPCTPRPR